MVVDESVNAQCTQCDVYSTRVFCYMLSWTIKGSIHCSCMEQTPEIDPAKDLSTNAQDEVEPDARASGGGRG